MLQVDLTALSGAELRRLLDTTRQRGQADLSYRILQEMEARRAPRPRGPEPRVIDLGPDPAAPEDDPGPAQADAIPDDEPLHVAWHEPVHPGAPPKRLRPIGFAIGVSLGVIAGVALGLGVAEATFQPDAPPPAPAMTALLSPSPTPATPASPALAVTENTAPQPTAPTPAPDAAPDAARAAQPASDTAADSAATPPAPPEPEPAPPTEPPKPACASGPPADRVICRDPDLRFLQQRLRRAYARALAAHEDRGLLRERQLAWSDARDNITDPVRLARLYEDRTRKLNAAAAAARSIPAGRPVARPSRR